MDAPVSPESGKWRAIGGRLLLLAVVAAAEGERQTFLRQTLVEAEQHGEEIGMTSGAVVSRRGFVAGGLMSLAAVATHANQMPPAGDEIARGRSTLLDVDLRRLVSHADLTYDQPTTRCEEGMPVGNSRVGSLVWTTPEALHFQINHADLYAMGCNTNSFPRAGTDYSNGCGFVDINLVDYGDDVFSGPSFRQHLSVYDALLTACGAGVTARVLAWTEQDVFVVEIDDERSRPEPINIDLRMLRYAKDEVYDNLKVRGKKVPDRRYEELDGAHAVVVRTAAHTATSRLHVLGSRIALTEVFEEDDFYSTSAVVIGVEGRKTKAKYLNETTVRLSVAPGTGKIIVYVAAAARYGRSEDVVASATKKLDAAMPGHFEGCLSTNQKLWHEFWSKGFVHLHSSDHAADYVEQNYTYFLYLMGSSSLGKYPPRFGGMLWYATGDMRKWGSQHWWNNDGIYYEGLIPANRLELMDPFFKMYRANYQSYAEAAEKQWGSKGIWIPETSWFDGLEKLPEDITAEMQELYLMRKPWDQRSEQFRRYEQVKQTFSSRWNFLNQDGEWELGRWNCGDKGAGPFGHTTHILSSTAKIAFLFWLRYDVTRDEGFLRDYAYPMLKGTTEFYRNFPNLKKGPDGKYHIYHVNNHEPIWDAQDTQEELTAIRAITPLTIAASDILAVDAEMRSLWQEFLDNLIPLATNEIARTRKPGEPVIWVGTVSPNKTQSEPAVLPIAFYDLCTIATEDPEMTAIGKATYDASTAGGVSETTPCETLSRAAVTAAKMGRADHVRFLIPNQLKWIGNEQFSEALAGIGNIGVMCNRLSMIEGPGCLEFERGGNATRALHSALLLDAPPAPFKPPVIQVFPACPKEWDAEFTLLARGGFLVTSAHKDGNVEFVEIKSQAGETCHLKNPWGDVDAILYRNGVPAEKIKGGLLAFKTSRDETILILKKGTLPAQFKRFIAREA